MKLSEFDVKIPNDLIAQYPVARGAARMMVVHRKTGLIEHKVFRDILEYFTDGDLLILNNSKVFPAKLYGNKEKTGARIEVFLLRELNKDNRLWDVVVDPARKIRVGNKLFFGENSLVAEVVDNTTSRGRTIRFLHDSQDDEFYNIIDRLGQMPIPPYISRPTEFEDRDHYQTVFAKYKGSVAASEAGLHFTLEILKRLELKGVDHSFVTLHTGLGSLRDVEVEDLSKHKMDSEPIEITPNCADKVNQAKDARKRICAVGATTMRAIESSVSALKYLNPTKTWTDRFIFPPYDFNIANSFLTNFHPPKSTLLMMASAFMGYELMNKVYTEAVKEKYRFYCYGDAMLIL